MVFKLNLNFFLFKLVSGSFKSHVNQSKLSVNFFFSAVYQKALNLVVPKLHLFLLKNLTIYSNK